MPEVELEFFGAAGTVTVLSIVGRLLARVKSWQLAVGDGERR